MAMRLQLVQMPPAAFILPDPAQVVSPSELSEALRWDCSRPDALSRLWLSYSRHVLSEAEPCPAVNGGADATVDWLRSMDEAEKVSVTCLSEGNYRLSLGRADLCLSETEEGDVYLYFCSPRRRPGRGKECRLDLTDCGSDDAAGFIAAALSAYDSIVNFYNNRKI